MIAAFKISISQTAGVYESKPTLVKTQIAKIYGCSFPKYDIRFWTIALYVRMQRWRAVAPGSQKWQWKTPHLVRQFFYWNHRAQA